MLTCKLKTASNIKLQTTPKYVFYCFLQCGTHWHIMHC